MTLYRYLVSVVVTDETSHRKFSRLVVTYATTDTRARCQAIAFISCDYAVRNHEYSFRITRVSRELLVTHFQL